MLLLSVAYSLAVMTVASDCVNVAKFEFEMLFVALSILESAVSTKQIRAYAFTNSQETACVWNKYGA